MAGPAGITFARSGGARRCGNWRALVTAPFIPGEACWVDVSVSDPEASRDFYTGLFGWTYQINPDPGHYTHALLDGEPVAGLGGVPVEPGQPVAWTLYLSSDNAAHTANEIGEHGGHVLFGPVDFPGQGIMVVATDPTGAQIGFWEPAEEWRFRAGVPGSLCWAELNTWDGQAADEFFAELFGYRQEQIGDGVGFDYTVWSLGTEALLGRRRMGDEFPSDASPHWMLYFSVAPETGADAAVARVAELGGWVSVHPFTSPSGRIAVVQDPGGAVFALIDPTVQAEPTRGEAGVDDPYDD